MALTRSKITVLVAPIGADGKADHGAEPELHELMLVHGDRLRAELEGPKYGLQMEKAPMHYAALWAWSALVRNHLVDQPFMDFKDRLVDVDVDDNIEVPPTKAAKSSSDSPSDSTGPESTGSTPSGPSPESTPSY
jgi:hypothetical protein